MALDVYVMPLWRFKVGDFSSPIETGLRIRPKIVTAQGIEDTPAKVGWFGRRRARGEVNGIRKSVEAVNRTPIHWPDEGKVVYSQQSWGFEPLRAFARWLDCKEQFSSFELPPDRDYYKHPVMATQVAQWTCRHLIEHSCHSGYFLPCEFEWMVEVEPYLIFGEWPASRQVGLIVVSIRNACVLFIESARDHSCLFFFPWRSVVLSLILTKQVNYSHPLEFPHDSSIHGARCRARMCSRRSCGRRWILENEPALWRS